MAIFAIIGVLVLAIVLYLGFKPKPAQKKTELDEETEGLIFDPGTGKYVTVEELVQSHQLDVIDDEKIRNVFDSLPVEMKQEISIKEVEAILESHYQFRVFESAEEKPGEDYILQVIYDGFQRKGKDIGIATIAEVIKSYSSLSSPAK